MSDEQKTPAMLPSALYYASRGWKVFPLVPRGKRPLTKRGVHDASDNPEQIKAWWREHPTANIGLACGWESGIDVLDVDGPKGEETLALLVAVHGDLPPTLASRTGRGRHIFFAHDGAVKNSSGKIGHKIDTRADGGYVVAPPSVHPSGAVYEWAAAPRDFPSLPQWPAWMVDAFHERPEEPYAPESRDDARYDDDHARKYCLAALEQETAQLADVAQGGRNDALNTAAFNLGGLVATGYLGAEEVRAAVREACERNGLIKDDGTRQFGKTFASGLQAGMRKARTIPEPRYAERAYRQSGSPHGPPIDDAPIPDPDDEQSLEQWREDAEAQSKAAATPAPSALGFGDVLAAWADEGPLVHQPTGFAELDKTTGGGPVFGSRWYITGAPNAGKTALLVQMGHTFAEAGIAVGFLAVDEEPGDLTTRFLQRIGHSRRSTETRHAHTLSAMRADLADLPVRLYPPGFTIESAADDLAAFAKERGSRAALMIDSAQTVRCEAEQNAKRELSNADSVGARVAAIRRKATEHRMLTVTASEMSRAAYRSKSTQDRITDMAASKWSGDIEYSARVLVALRSVPGESDVVELSVVKNKHGPEMRGFLRLDRVRQELTEADYEPEPDDDGEARERDRDALRKRRTVVAAARIAEAIAAQPGINTRQLRVQVGMSKERISMGLELLGTAVTVSVGARRQRLHYLDGSLISLPVRDVLIEATQAFVVASRPPEMST